MRNAHRDWKCDWFANRSTRWWQAHLTYIIYIKIYLFHDIFKRLLQVPVAAHQFVEHLERKYYIDNQCNSCNVFFIQHWHKSIIISYQSIVTSKLSLILHIISNNITINIIDDNRSKLWGECILTCIITIQYWHPICIWHTDWPLILYIFHIWYLYMPSYNLSIFFSFKYAHIGFPKFWVTILNDASSGGYTNQTIIVTFWHLLHHIKDLNDCVSVQIQFYNRYNLIHWYYQQKSETYQYAVKNG